MTPEPNRPDEREAAELVRALVEKWEAQSRALDGPGRHYTTLDRCADELGQVLAKINERNARRDAPREGASVEAAAWEYFYTNGCDGFVRYLSKRDPRESHGHDITVRPLIYGDTPDRAPREGGEVRAALDSYAEHGRPYPTNEDLRRAAAMVPQDQFTTPIPASPPSDAVGALVGKWREAANGLPERPQDDAYIQGSDSGARTIYRSCADELAAALGSRPVVDEAVVSQALTDPENQPSQWGTIPLSMLPARRERPYDESHDQDSAYENGVASGWNACLDAIATLRAPEQPS